MRSQSREQTCPGYLGNSCRVDSYLASLDFHARALQTSTLGLCTRLNHCTAWFPWFFALSFKAALNTRASFSLSFTRSLPLGVFSWDRSTLKRPIYFSTCRYLSEFTLETMERSVTELKWILSLALKAVVRVALCGGRLLVGPAWRNLTRGGYGGS